MGNHHGGGAFAARLRAIRDAQHRVAKRLREVQEELKKLDRSPVTQPWIASSRRVSTVRELRSPFRTLREALEHDLRALRAQTRELKRQAASVRRAVARQPAKQASTEYRRRLDEALKRAEHKGHVDDAELASLLQGSEQVLGMFVRILEADPSPTNIDAVLEQMEVPALLRGGTTGGACGRAKRALARAGTSLYNDATSHFRRNPSTPNFDKMMQARELARQLGGDVKHGTPARKDGQSGTVHVVAEGDTLAKISQRYYGSPGHWDTIYFRNLSTIGPDPEKLEVGQSLVIP